MPALPESVPDDVSIRGVLVADEWARVMRAIAERHGLGDAEPIPCDRGSDVVYRLGTRAVVKLTTPRWTGQIQTESTFLQAVAGKLSVATPEVLATGEFDGWPYVITSFLAGEHLADVWPALSSVGRVRVAEQLGTLMAELHDVDVPELERPEWTEFMSLQRNNATETQRRRGTPEPWLEAMQAFLGEVPALYRSADPTVSLHTELLDAHVFVDRGDDACRLCGLIDFADGMRGRADYDIAALVEFIFAAEKSLLRTCLLSYGWSQERLNEDEGRRLLGCALLHRYSSLPRMLRAAGISPEQDADFDLLRRRLYELKAA